MRRVYRDTDLMLGTDTEEATAQLRELLSRYEKECGIVQPDGTRLYPDGVAPQEVSQRKSLNMALLYNLLRWARRLL
nr:phospholipase D family protein [Lachnospiraceae bacterium]